jgi:hypothetical protein
MSSSSKQSLNASLIDSSDSYPNTLSRAVIGNLRDLLILPTIVHAFSTSTSSHGPFSGITLKLHLLTSFGE